MRKLLVFVAILIFVGFIFPTPVFGQNEGESRLWFPHLRLISELSAIAQSMIAPHPSSLSKNAPLSNGSPSLENVGLVTTRIEEHQGIDDPGNPILPNGVVNTTTNNSSLVVDKNAPRADSLLSNTIDPYNTAQCYFPEAISDPGDDLLGPQITGRVTYTNKFEFDALPITASSEGDVKLTAKGQINPFVKVPLIEQIYNSMVNGSDSLFKRFMPSEKTQDIQEIPAAVGYQVSAQSVNGTGTVKTIQTGDSSNPVLYVPHIGSLKKYWLEDLQTALRPQGIAHTTNAPPTKTSACESGIPNSVPEPVKNLMASGKSPLDAALQHASTRYLVPTCTLEAVMGIETGLGRYVNWDEIVSNPTLQERYMWEGNTEIVCDEASGEERAHNQCSARGPFQITTGPSGVYCRDVEPKCPYQDLGTTTDNCTYSCNLYCDSNGVVASKVPNAWASVGNASGRSNSQPTNLYDAMMAAAKLLNSKAGGVNSSNWTDSQIVTAGNNYYGSDEKHPVLGNRSYGQALLAYCKGNFGQLFP